MVNIDSVSFGEIEINGKTYFSDMIVWWDGIVEFVTKKHIVGMDELASILKRNPKIVIIGTGDKESVHVEPEVREHCENEGIKLYIDPTTKAVDLFNGLVLQKKKVAGMFHVTC